MSDISIHAMHRKMERFLGYNPDNEIRPDTVGALYSEVQESEWRRRNREQNNLNKLKHDEEEEGLISIGTFIYDFKNKTEEFFRYKSRGKK